MKLHLNIIPLTTIKHYNINNIKIFPINQGIYVLPQSCKFSHTQLITLLTHHNFHNYPLTQYLWTHYTITIYFILCVDYFSIKYTNKEDVIYLKTIYKTYTYKNGMVIINVY